jgi:hypothetical protein
MACSREGISSSCKLYVRIKGFFREGTEERASSSVSANIRPGGAPNEAEADLSCGAGGGIP